MTDDDSRSQVQVAVARLVSETGVTEMQARELISLLGLNWPSLVREARLIKKGL